MKRKPLKCIIAVIVFTESVFGWGKTGHRIIGMVAENYLSEVAKTEIKKLLGHHDISRISNWADEIRSDPTWGHASDWHYCTIPDNEQYKKGKHAGKAVEKINEFSEILKNKNSGVEEKKIALKFMVHLIQDLHQPLHVGNGKDRGGNSVKVKWFGEKTNLHSVWDTKLFELQKLSYSEYANYLLLDADHETIIKWQKNTVFDYIEESKKYRVQCYDFKGENLTWNYLFKNKNLLELRLLQGGARLSGQLNQIFK